MSKSKKHHYISQFYLRGFGEPVKTKNRGDDHLLGVLDFGSAKTLETLVGNIAFQNHFNKIENFQTHENELEDSLIDIEGRISQSVYALENSGELTEPDKNNLCLLMALFASRTPSVREKLKNENIKIQDELHHAITSFPHLSKDRTDGVTFEMLQHAKNTGQIKAVVPSQDILIDSELTLVSHLVHHLSQRTWIVLRTGNEQDKLITSDCPVVLLNLNTGIEPIHFSHTSVCDPQTDVYFPVTENIAIYGVFENRNTPNMAGLCFAALNTYIVNKGGRQFYYHPPGFSVINSKLELDTHEDILNSVREYHKVAKPVPTSAPQSSAKDWTDMNIDDFIEVIKKG